MLDKLRIHGLDPATEALGNSLNIDWRIVWALAQKYGVVVIELLPKLLPLLASKDYAGVIQLILDALHTTPPAMLPLT